MFGKQKNYTYGKQSISWGDIWAVVKTLRSNWLTQGPKIQEFEQAICDYTGAQYCVVVANGTAALHLAVLATDIKPGDEVITSPITFLASANCVLYAGGTVRFADIDPKTACIDPKEITKQITPRSRGVIPVHFAGHPCDMEEICSIAKTNNLFVIEDAAHAIGSVYKGSRIGSCKYSDMTVFSFHPVKTITTGEGGAITTNRRDIYEKLLILRSHGMTKNPALMTQNDGPWYYQMHELGFNYRMTDMQAALGLAQLKKMDKFVQHRRMLVDLYRKAFADMDVISLLEEKQYSKAAYHLFPILVDFEKLSISKKQFFEKLQQRGLNLQVHYIPVHLQPYYKKLGFNEHDYPQAEEYYRRTLSLPLYGDLTIRDIKKIENIIKSILSF